MCSQMLQTILTFSHKNPSVTSSVLANFLPQVLDYRLLGFDLGSEGVHVRVSVLPHGGPDLPPVDQPHVLVEICLSDILTDWSEQVDEGLQHVP